MYTEKTIKWNGAVQPEAIEILTKPSGMIVSPTKVGYIIMTTDKQGLERKFEAKQRNRNKPGVVLCCSLEQLFSLAEVNDEIKELYQQHWDRDILLGCILPWKQSAKEQLLDNELQELMMDTRGTSCFVIKFGKPSEMIAYELWTKYQKFSFASSANPSGQGNRGLVTGIGDRIASRADLIIDANDYVASIQPPATTKTRYEQGVMVSLVDKAGKLIPIQNKERLITPCPVLIRKGLDVDKITTILSNIFNSWDYRHGDYY